MTVAIRLPWGSVGFGNGRILRVTFALVLGVIGSATALLWKAREDAVADWRLQLDKQSLMLAAHAHQTVKAVDLLLAGICEDIRSATAEQVADAILTSRHLHEELHERLKGVPQAATAAIVGLDGMMLNQAAQFPAGPVRLDDRDFMKAHVADPTLDVFVSRTNVSRVTGRATIFVARKVRDQRGRPLAVAIAGLEVSFFDGFYDRIRNGDGSVISVFKDDGSLLVRSPRDQDLPGRDRTGSAVPLRQLAPDPTLASRYAPGPHVDDPSDISSRMVASRRLMEYPIVVSVEVPERMLLAKWRTTMHVVTISASGFIVVIVASALWMASAGKRQRETSASLREAERIAADQQVEIAARMRNEQILLRDVETRSQIATFDQQLSEAVRRIGLAIEEMASQSERLADASDRALEGSGSAARSAARAASYVETVATSAELVSNSAGAISSHAATSARALEDILHEADHSLDAVATLATATREIDAVSVLIRHVASQTNLLALNATIEAARAGQTGRGFAVVASEIKALASQTTGATAEISRQIGAIQSAGQRCVSALETIHRRLAEARVITDGIAAKVADQTQSTTEIARTIRAAAQEAVSVSENALAVSTAARLSNDGVVGVLSSARLLNDEVRIIRTRIEAFSETLVPSVDTAEAGSAVPAG